MTFWTEGIPEALRVALAGREKKNKGFGLVSVLNFVLNIKDSRPAPTFCYPVRQKDNYKRFGECGKCLFYKFITTL